MHCEIAGVALTTVQCVCVPSVKGTERDRERRGLRQGDDMLFVGRQRLLVLSQDMWQQQQQAQNSLCSWQFLLAQRSRSLKLAFIRSEGVTPTHTRKDSHADIFQIYNLCASAEKTNEWFVLLVTFLLIYPEGGSPRDVDVGQPLFHFFPIHCCWTVHWLKNCTRNAR